MFLGIYLLLRSTEVASSAERFTYKCTHFRDKIIMTLENLTQEILPTIY